jgi:hypothetical protein
LDSDSPLTVPASAPDSQANVAALAPTSGAQAINAILNDQTLRPGDAYVGTEGVRIYVGSSGNALPTEDFVPLPPTIMAEAKFRALLAPYHSTTTAKKLSAIEVKPLSPAAALLPLALHPSPAAPAPLASHDSLAAHLPSNAPLPPPRPASAQEQIITDASGKKIRLVGAYVPL